ncbi:MAG: transglutaminase family protein [Synechococcaceae cyanobacterium]|nr:transglutaminase family protein [Synechococcaceae cyanobacterium]
MEPVARAAERRLAAAGIRLTLGGEPTFVPFRPEGAEWNVAADGPTKLPLARRLARELQREVWPGSTLLYCPGKRYEGEVNPRWALRLITGPAETPPVRWPDPCQPGLRGHRPEPAEALAWLERMGRALGVALHPLPLRDPLDPDRRVWAAPLTVEETDPPEGEAIPWRAAPWPLAGELRELSGAPGPAGLRLPLERFPAELPCRLLTLEVDPDGWELFLPPLLRRPTEVLLQAVADALGDLAAPRLSGMLPADADGHWTILGLTADPGVLEINLPVCRSWAEYDGWLRRLETLGHRLELRTWKPGPEGRPESTGGGNHLLWGGPSLEEHPFFSRPAWLAGILRYWQHHPALAYLFCGPSVGPASQSPRPDEAAGGIFDLELAYRAIEAAADRPGEAPWGDHRGLIGETLRHLHADRSGNNHRSEISFDKFWNPGAPAGCLGLIEFRALESLPRVEWSSAIALLWSALAAHLLEPGHRPGSLRDWGHRLHDRLLLPSELWSDLEGVLADLAGDGLVLDPAPFREIWDWRFPLLLQWRGPAAGGEAGAPLLEIRQALEPWPLICDVPREGGFTSRFVDASLRRFEVVGNAAFRRHCSVGLNGRPLPLDPEPLAVRFRHHRLYPCLHPAIDPHLPITLVVDSPSGRHAFRLEEGCQSFTPLDPREVAPAAMEIPGDAPPWRGRKRAGDVTVDLRLG